ncbi:hypothetical protein AC249_AIPGENE28357 [Exaiptasia diaphana]|nr:hypothetical protein AC249_AIPGENE28357 [Exaiptasia diaphana]
MLGESKKSLEVEVKSFGEGISPVWYVNNNVNGRWHLGSVPIRSLRPYKIIIRGKTESASDAIRLGYAYKTKKLCREDDRQLNHICKKNITSGPGFIASPYYPLYFPRNVCCTWDMSNNRLFYVAPNAFVNGSSIEFMRLNINFLMKVPQNFQYLDQLKTLWIDSDLEAHEDILGFYQIPNIGADTITLVIQDALTRLTLSTDKCRGQCYDGASNMLGAKTGKRTSVTLRAKKLPKKRRAPTRCEMGSGEPQYPSTPRDYYRAIFFEALDCLMSAIKECFKQPAFLVYKNLESLLVNAAHGNDIAKEMDELSSYFSGNVSLPTLEAQLSTSDNIKT